MDNLIGGLALRAARSSLVKRAYGFAMPGGFTPGMGYGGYGGGGPMGGYGFGGGGMMGSPSFVPMQQLAMMRNPANAYIQQQEQSALGREDQINAEKAKVQKLYREAKDAARGTSLGWNGWNPFQDSDMKYRNIINPDTEVTETPEFGSSLLGSGEKGWFGATGASPTWNAWRRARDEYDNAYTLYAKHKKSLEGQTERERSRASQQQNLMNNFQQQQVQNQQQRQDAETGMYGREYGAQGAMGTTSANAYGNAMGQAGMPPAGWGASGPPGPGAEPAGASPPGAPPVAPPGAPPPGAPPGPGGRPASGRADIDLIDRLAQAAASSLVKRAAGPLADDDMPVQELDTHMHDLHPGRRPRAQMARSAGGSKQPKTRTTELQLLKAGSMVDRLALAAARR